MLHPGQLIIGWLIAGALENTPPRQWFVYGTVLITVPCGLLRTVSNLREMRRLGQYGAGHYAVREWGASFALVRIFLAAECFVVDVLSVLVLNDVALW
ncbi:hypothetical protein LD112_25450 [Pantoea agglomerans]|nr:hypothetical protein [Pantoea agglomerans]